MRVFPIFLHVQKSPLSLDTSNSQQSYRLSTGSDSVPSLLLSPVKSVHFYSSLNIPQLSESNQGGISEFHHTSYTQVSKRH